MTTIFRSLVAVTTVALLAGCATQPDTALIAGRATLIPGTVRVDLVSVKALLSVDNERYAAQVFVSDCRAGIGAFWFDAPHYARVENLVASGSTPADKMFAQICNEALPIVLANEAAQEKRWANLTPEQRAAEAQILMQLLMFEERQQSDRARADANERAERGIEDAIRDGRKTSTECISPDFQTIRCTTEPKR